MNNINTNKWKQSGRLFLWRYEENPKNYRGLHLTADADGCRSLIELLNFMVKSEEESKRTIKLYPTTEYELKVTGCNNRAMPCSKLILTNRKDNDDYWNISDHNGIATIEGGNNSLSKMVGGLQDIQQGQGDYFIGSEGHELWFWWYITANNFIEPTGINRGGFLEAGCPCGS